MVKVFKILILCLFFVSCTKESKKDNCYLEINNKELSSQIKEYRHFVDSLNKGKVYVIVVYCSQINDSLNKYVITCCANAYSFTLQPYSFKCNVDNLDVFFVMVSSLVNSPDYGKTNLNFFKNNKDVLMEDVKKHFPNEYDYYLKNGDFTFKSIFEPELLYLTFKYNVLIKKTYKKGSYLDK
jgi:hypothetical protein